MRIEELVKLLRGRPFEPFVIHMSDGADYTVRHPDQIIVTSRAAYVGVRSNAEGTVAQDVAICDLMHITRLRPARKRRTRRRSG